MPGQSAIFVIGLDLEDFAKDEHLSVTSESSEQMNLCRNAFLKQLNEGQFSLQP